jgi:hypothetical protein
MLVRSSVLVAAEVFVRGVPVVLPPLTDPLGVEDEVPTDFPLAFAEPFAAFSARRFCLDAEGGMLWEGGSDSMDLIMTSKKLAVDLKCLTPLPY